MGEEVNHVYPTFPCCDKHLREPHRGKTSLDWFMVSNQHGGEDVGIRAPHVMAAGETERKSGSGSGGERRCEESGGETGVPMYERRIN